MTPKQTKATMQDIVSRNPSVVARAVLDRALKNAYEDQQKILEKAKKIK